MTLDFLIIGQGLAGSLLAWELINRGCKVLVIDSGKENASMCAAGLINPITGMRFVKSTQVDVLLPFAKRYYQQLSEFFQQTFYFEKNMLRLFNNEKELLYAQKRRQDSHYQPYLGDIIQTSAFNAPFGLIEQTQTAYVLTQALLSALKQFLIAQQSYQQRQVDYNDIIIGENLTCAGIATKQLIFCEGYYLRDNPWFSALPLQPVKGEILTLQNLKPLPDKILNDGHWLIPLDAHLFRIGATFDPVQLDTLCTVAAKNQLLSALHSLLPDTRTAKVLTQQANIRPCTLDKQPFIGRHPHYPNLAVFNGFGAKGCLQIPYYSQQFANYLLKNMPLDAIVACQRYQKIMV
jgi:glycine/D-amino acid oxidase-like deaminating enzyme